MVEDLIVLEPGDERAQKIGRAIGSPTAGEILQALRGGPKTSSEITEILDIPMSTAKYHIENLLDAGLLEVAETKYSVKGREVKVYRLKDQVVIVAPRTPNAKSLLLRYASLFGITAVGSLLIIAIGRLYSLPVANVMEDGLQKEAYGGAAGTASTSVPPEVSPVPTVLSRTGEVVSTLVTQDSGEKMYCATSPASIPQVAPGGSGPDGTHIASPVTEGTLFPDLALAFFLGGCLVIGILLMYEFYLWHKTRKASGEPPLSPGE
ncbi:MAG: helix-turn-helix domain-containing protein [Methanoregulaceae archaeon]|nr:helix-turn-helix domain-containing protein [Methanoregulaceae archaeon]